MYINDKIMKQRFAFIFYTYGKKENNKIIIML